MSLTQNNANTGRDLVFLGRPPPGGWAGLPMRLTIWIILLLILVFQICIIDTPMLPEGLASRASARRPVQAVGAGRPPMTHFADPVDSLQAAWPRGPRQCATACHAVGHAGRRTPPSRSVTQSVTQACHGAGSRCSRRGCR